MVLKLASQHDKILKLLRSQDSPSLAPGGNAEASGLPTSHEGKKPEEEHQGPSPLLANGLMVEKDDGRHSNQIITFGDHVDFSGAFDIAIGSNNIINNSVPVGRPGAAAQGTNCFKL